jgi:hypothetical protein
MIIKPRAPSLIHSPFHSTTKPPHLFSHQTETQKDANRAKRVSLRGVFSLKKHQRFSPGFLYKNIAFWKIMPLENIKNDGTNYSNAFAPFKDVTETSKELILSLKLLLSPRPFPPLPATIVSVS